MNKIFLTFVALSFLLVPSLSFAVTAEIQKPFFDLEIKDIVGIDGTDLTLFYFAPINIQDSSKISSWKVRFYCEDDMKIRFYDVSKDSCGEAVDMINSGNNSFFMLFENKGGESKNFSIALKAYDKEGKWIHTERQRFGWN
jgi:hypothetical protein